MRQEKKKLMRKYWNDKAGVKEIDEETEFIMEVSKAIGMKMLITVPSFDVKDKSVSEIKEEAVERLRYLSDKVGEDIKISLEFCGAPNCSINQFGTAYDVVKLIEAMLELRLIHSISMKCVQN